MIKVQDWIASIPDEEKHIAYVGEGKSVQKEFLLCGEGWETYQHWTFFLDMAFDLESITTRDSRQVVSTQINRSEIDEATGVTADEVIFKETYTVHDEKVLGYDQTDIAPLTKRVEKDGIHLTWTVLRQHTVLPGKLWATLRAVSGEIDQIKKSDILVFEVDAAICAVPATVPAISVMEQMCQQAAEAKDAAIAAKEFAESAATGANRAAADALNAQFVTENYAELTKERWQETVTNAAAAQQAQEQAAAEARAAAENKQAAYDLALSARQSSEEAAVSAQVAAEMRGEASNQANAAAQMHQQARKAAEDAAASATAAREAAEQNKTLIVTTELVQNGMAYELKSTHAASEIYQHVQQGGTAVLDWMGGECLTLSSCTEQTAVFSAVTKNGNDARATIVTIDNDKSWTSSGATLGGGGTAEYNRVNVRDYGAVGDGVTDDRQAIVNAFTAAKSMLPCEVYFPAGTYGISNGITVEMAYGTGGLLVRGAGRDVTAIKYLDSFDPNRTGVQWYAIRIWPVGMPDTKPTNEDDYLHDISITGLTVYDENPYEHALNSHKGDKSKEENHGFDLQYIKRVSVTECKIDSVGDEGIDVCACHDVVIMNNHLVNTPGAGYGGGAISIGDGSKGVVVSGNTINKTAEDEVLVAGTVLPAGTVLFADTTLADGTTLTAGTKLTEPITLAEDMVLAKSNFGIAVESLTIPVSEVVVSGNTILGVRGSGVHFNTPQAGTNITNLSITDNIINGCTSGIVASGEKSKDGLKIHGNMISDCAKDGMELRGGMGDVTIVGNTIRNAYTGVTAVQINSRQLYADNLFENIGDRALYVRGKVTVKDCVFNDIGMTTRPTGAICNDVSASTNGTLTVSGCTMRGVRASNAIYGAQAVYYTDIELINSSGVANAGGECFGGSKDCQLKTLIGGNLGGRVKINVDNAIVQGVSITSSSIGSNAITINANGVMVTGCNINMASGSYPAIKEADGKNHNLFANNIYNRGTISVVGAQSVAVNNIDTRVTA